MSLITRYDLYLSKEINFSLTGQRSSLLVYIRIFTNASQYKNANIANFVLALPLEKYHTNVVYNLEM